MKDQIGIWIDGSKAVIVNVNNAQPIINTIESAIENRIYHGKEGNKGTFNGLRHINQDRRFEERKKHQVNEYIKEIIFRTKNAKKLYLFGPAEMKIRLKKEIEADKLLSQKLIAVETTDKMTKNQIVAKVRNFYNPL